jgi:UDP-N-acetylmuramoylalanine--D-glutamate ligase
MAFSVANQRVHVVGAGRSGQAAARLLVSRGAIVTLDEVDATVADDLGPLRAAGVRIVLGPHQDGQLTESDLVVLSPGVPPHLAVVDEARRAGIPVIGEVELASRWLSGRVIAITGTKGKSTTTTLAARMLQEGGFTATAGGNLGIALSDQVADSRPDAIHVVEVSSFQLETTDTFHPWIAVLLNLSPDHLDRHASFDAYVGAKARVFRNQTSGDWTVVNADDEGARALARPALGRRFDFGLESTLTDGVTIEGGRIVARRGGRPTPLLPLSSVRLPGRHLLADVLAAAAVGVVAGVEPAAIDRAVRGFGGLPHTLEPIGEIGGVRFVNDSKATNVAAARRAIESFDEGVVAIMGGRLCTRSQFFGERIPRLDSTGLSIKFQNEFLVELSRPPRPLRVHPA